jgi:hypothetical protein
MPQHTSAGRKFPVRDLRTGLRMPSFALGVNCTDLMPFGNKLGTILFRITPNVSQAGKDEHPHTLVILVFIIVV